MALHDRPLFNGQFFAGCQHETNAVDGERPALPAKLGGENFRNTVANAAARQFDERRALFQFPQIANVRRRQSRLTLPPGQRSEN